MALSKEAIIGANDIPTKLISVPEWGGEVYVKRQSIRERDALIPISDGFMSVEAPTKQGEKPKITMKKGEEAEKAYAKYRLFSVGYALCDEHGNRLFSDEEIESVLGKKSIASIERVYVELGKFFNEESLPTT